MPRGIASDDGAQPIVLRYVLQTFMPRAAEVRAPMKWSPANTSPLLGTQIQRTPLFFTAKSFCDAYIQECGKKHVGSATH